MNIEGLVAKYIRNTGQAFKEIQIQNAEEVTLSRKKVEEVIGYAKNYFEDTKYHYDRKQFEVALASIAYCEGLLDALRLLGVADFQWPTSK
ncbi:MAG: DUF357 domain-containing protein [Candidatus Bathyarchaeia archaeon]|jgi:FAD synthetase|nr:DUF357 domain-containing protein [Candidatus Bathyarchaeota archaeon A05DMB-4]MDH7595313.1 DUF357 domain-containing protein [Candidatus Bathyarchaeota archaeon]